MRSSRVLLSALSAAAVACFVLTSAPPATAALNPPAASQQAVQQFLSNPAAWMAQYQDGGGQMIAAVRDLASDPQTLNALVGLLSSANSSQASAIGTGLGQVALTVLGADQAYATQIQTAVTAAGNSSALVAFDAVVGGNIKLSAATSGGGGGGGGEAPTGPNSPSGGINGNSGLNLPTFGNRADNFTSQGFPSAGPGTPVSQSSP
jgi:hypothetical protein